jgi:BirA family biotin operon repressor/biotin-[acetyl-CoA-carboxylase] ligase
MKLIKLDAIDSTNEFLKGLSSQQTLENFTVVTAENQTKGKGQMGSVWDSEVGKNLIMSVLIKDFLPDTNQIFNLNIAVSMAVIQALNELWIPKLTIKWPNDIMSDHKKMGGILIENSIKSDGTIFSVIGLGLNVNQVDFKNLPQATSLAVVCKTQFDREQILSGIVERLKYNVRFWNQNSTALWAGYQESLFKTGVPMPFKDIKNQHFMGIIQGVSVSGKLQVLLENEAVMEYDIKEIQMLY